MTVSCAQKRGRMPNLSVFSNERIKKTQQKIARTRETLRRSREVLRTSREVQADRERSEHLKAPDDTLSMADAD